MGDSETFLQQLLETFRLEAQDHVGALATALVSLENEREPTARAGLIETIFRRMHTLKGAAHAVNLLDVARACQELEDLLADLKRGDLVLDLPLFDRLHAGVDAAVALIAAAGMGGPAPGSRPAVPGTAPEPGAEAAGKAIPERMPAGGAVSEGKGAARAWQHPHQEETVRVPTRRLAELLLQAEELVAAKLAATLLAEETGQAWAELQARDQARQRALELAREVIRGGRGSAEGAKLAALLEESCREEQRTEERLLLMKKRTEKNLRALAGMTDPLLEDMKKLHLLPVSSLTDPFGKLVRDLARELDKEAELFVFGGGVEMDRRILDELKEPLLHLVRNVMDHGLEARQERLQRGKPPRGRIRIEIRPLDANRAELSISDDGRGIDVARVRREALRLELATAEELERLPDGEALQMVFESGISTSPVITTLSGRGVGLAIVRESLDRLGGHATVESRPGEGTEFRLSLPLSFSMMRALLVESAGRECFLPAANVELCARVPLREIGSVENRETVLLGEELLSLVSLARLLELDGGGEGSDGFQSVVLVSALDKRIALAVDRVIGVREILVKPLGSQLSRVRNVAGATVMGNGQVVPILNLSDLFRSALARQGAVGVGREPAPRSSSRRLSVLVVEDSITSRTLLKNILESSGFLVRTAIDGMDALFQLKSEGCDIVISDVEMPRMDGFQLTAAIRADGRFDELPVVLVTGLESRADRERGIEVGANAYLVKSGFDQNGLIEIIEKLT